MSASATDKFKRASNGTRPVPTTLTALKAVGASSISCGALTGWATTTGVDFIIYTVTTAGVKNNDQTEWSGVVSGTTITNLTLRAGTDNGYAVGAIVECAPTAGWGDDIATGLAVEHNQDGTHANITTPQITATAGIFTSLSITGSATSQGWTALGANPNTVTALGNQNYNLVFNAVDLTGTLTPGMKVRLARTVAAPNQSTLLNGTNQYYSKSSPGGMTFTDDFTVSAWIKLSSYGTNPGIISRYNGTSGWIFQLTSSGTIRLTGLNAGAANFSYVESYASVPLGKWVHVSAQLDMSAFTASTTTSYTMIDGVDVAAQVVRGGTNPTALIQAGNLEVGSYNAGNFFPGAIAQAAVYSAKVTQATILASMNQTLTGSETSLASAYSFNGVITDLSATANNLTANNAAVATNADSPYANAVTAGSLEYAEVTNISFSTNTTVGVRVPDGCVLPTTGGLGSSNYSTQSNPFGLPYFSKVLAQTLYLAGIGNQAQTSSTFIPGFSVSPIIPTGAKVKLTYSTAIQNTNADTVATTELYDGSLVSTNRVAVAQVVNRVSNAQDQIEKTVVLNPSSGLHTYTLSAYTTAGNFLVYGSSNAQSILQAELV